MAFGVFSRKQASLKEIYIKKVEKNKKRNVNILQVLFPIIQLTFMNTFPV